jgi:methyl-accepting chemotaxis protein
MAASVESVARIALQRQEALEQLVSITNKGGEQVEITNKLIEENANDVKEILEIIEIINNVASQTNLLSMNAAIEAAHASDSGRGFAVVAEEIRKLAESTNENSKRIRKTITTIADRIQQILEASNESSDSFQKIDHETRQK